MPSRDGPIVPLIAETGGQNAMIVDSSALPEQVTRDVVASSFQSAGQRCSALRVLCVQDDVADSMLEMIAGAMKALTVGDPAELTTDVGPVIDAEAKAALDAHLAELKAKKAKLLAEIELPASAAQGHFVTPSMYQIGSLADLDREHFGPILHVVRWKSGQLDKVIEPDQRHRLRPDARPAEPDRHHPPICRGQCPGRQPLRQPQPDRRGGRKPAVRRGGPVGHRAQGRRARTMSPASPPSA